VTVAPWFAQDGSIIADTATSQLLDLETAVEIATAAPRDEVAKLLETAERMCFVLNAVREPHAIRRRATVNGEPLVD
jgi:hypothetical protein